jgi:repressor LexA
MQEPLTRKEKEIFDFLKVTIQINGFAPSLMEMKNHFQLNSTSTIHEHINNLAKKGYIVKNKALGRNIQIIDPLLLEQGFLEIPVLFSLNRFELLDTLPQKKILSIHRSFLKENNTYSAISIDSDIYQSLGIINKDIIIVRKTQDAVKGSLSLVCLNKKTYILGKILQSSSGEKILEKQSENPIKVNFFEPYGQVDMLIRNYSE